MRDLATSKSVLKLVPIKWKQDFLLNALCSLPSGPIRFFTFFYFYKDEEGL